MNTPNERELKKFNGDYNKWLLKDQNGSYGWFIPIEVYSEVNNSYDDSDKVLLKDYYNRYRWFISKSKNKE